MDDVILEPIWHLRNLQAPPEGWEFSTNYKVPVQDPVLRSMLQGDRRAPLFAIYPELVPRVQVLATEVRGRAEREELVQEGAFNLRTRRVVDRLMRKPRQSGRERILICVGDLVDGKGNRRRDFQEAFELSGLSPTATAAVRDLDSAALELAHRMYAEKLEQLDEHPPAAVPLRKVRVFLGYRRAHLAIAKRLYAALQQFGGGTVFEPYLDFHQMHLGGWKEQLFQAVDEADVFMPLVSPDYGASGTVSLEELDRAKRHAAERGWADFIAPVFIGDAITAVARELRDLDGHVAADADSINPTNAALLHWLGRAAEAGIRRPR